MYVAIRKNSPCVFCNRSLGKKKLNSVVVGQKRCGENPVRIPICTYCAGGMKVLMDRRVSRRGKMMLKRYTRGRLRLEDVAYA